MTKPLVHIYGDGACLGNPGPGGWAVLLVFIRDKQRHEKLLSGSEKDSTNNRMELQAIIEGLKSLKQSCKAEVYSDSQYVTKGMKEWLPNWQKNAWKNSAGKPVVNQDLWQELSAQADRHHVSWHWVKGHAGHPENERVDEAARLAALSITTQH